MIVPVLGTIDSYTTLCVCGDWPDPIDFILKLDHTCEDTLLLVQAVLDTRRGVDLNVQDFFDSDTNFFDPMLAVPEVERTAIQRMLLAHELGRRRLALFKSLVLKPCEYDKTADLPALDAETARMVARHLAL